MKQVRKIKLPNENPFNIESIINKELGEKNKDYKNLNYTFSDNYIFLEYEKVLSPPPASSYNIIG